MSKTLTIGSQEFEFPTQGQSPDWGSTVTDFAEAVADALATVQQPNDILISSANIANNQTIAANIPGFSFTTSEVLSINAEYFITRSTTSPVSTVTESGSIKGNYDGSNWYITIQSENDAGVVFSITPSGQIQYTSSNIAGSGYNGSIKFKAKVINQ